VKALGIKGEVILPSFTFVASANAVETAGAVPVFADINSHNFNLDPVSVEDKITRRTEAIMPVHVAGRPVDMGAIARSAKKHKLAIIEDSAQAIGAEYKGKKTGTFGLGCFSFFPTKNMTTGEGGMITTNDEKIAKLVKTMGAHGISKDTYAREKSKKPWLRAAILAGYNLRMSNILAAIGVEQFKKLDFMNNRRISHAVYLNKNLKELEIDIPYFENDYRHVYQMYIISVNPKMRDKMFKYLIKNNIAATVFSDPPVHLQPYYRKKYGFKKGDLPKTEQAAKSNIVLPMFPQLAKSDLDRIILVIKKFIKYGKD
jgi:perosamine synthetase